MPSIWNMINGKKVYILAALMVAYAWIGYGLGYQDMDSAMKLAMEALAMAGLRHGVSKMEK